MAFAAVGGGVSDRVFRRVAGEDPRGGGGSEQGGSSGDRGYGAGAEGDFGDVDGGERGGDRGGEVLVGGDERVEGAGRSGCVDRGGGRVEGLSGGDRVPDQGGVSGGDGADVPGAPDPVFAGARLLEGAEGVGGALRPIYQADTLEEAEEALDGFEAGSWGRKFPAIVRSWRRNWAQVIPFFAFSKPIRRVIYTTNAIESLNSTVRRAVRTRGHFPNDRAAAKLIYLTLRKIERKWQRPQTFWSQARAGFAIVFGDRFPVEAL